MALNDHASRAHALLSASSSSRWLKCPPSAVAATLYENPDTEFTREGTLAHEVAEAVARGQAVQLDGKITAEMIRCAQSYADYIQELITDENAVVLLEQRLDFSPWVPDGFGTGDCIVIQGNRLDVVDYKFGQGVAVSAMDNSQMRLYGLGALNDFGDIYDIHEVVVHIFQPRMNNISKEELLVPDLLAWGEEVKPTAQNAAEGKGDYCAGEHCRFCQHAASCPALAAACAKVVNLHGGKAAVPSLAPWMTADILKSEPMISAWLKAVKDKALSDLLKGEEIPGYKVVAGKSSRVWSDDVAAVAALTAAGYGPADYYPMPELLSPYQLEKSIGKKKVAELVGSLIESKAGSPTVAPESDKRKPYSRQEASREAFK